MLILQSENRPVCIDLGNISIYLLSLFPYMAGLRRFLFAFRYGVVTGAQDSHVLWGRHDDLLNVLNGER